MSSTVEEQQKKRKLTAEQEEQEKKRTSIRPNGKIRPIPKNTESQLSYNTIQPGDKMINFHNEYLLERYYKEDVVKQLMASGALNPFSRAALASSDLKPYLASIDGDVGGKTVENLDRVPPADYSSVVVKYIRPPLFSQSTFYGFALTPIYPGRTQVGQNDLIYSKNDPLGRLLRHYTKTRNIHESPDEIVLKTFGIRDTPDSYLIKPFYKVKKNGVLITDYTQPLSTFVEPERTTIVEVEASRDNIIRNIYPTSIVEGLELPANVNPRVRGLWFTLQSDAYTTAKSLFLKWLADNQQEEAFYYMNGTFTENSIKKGASIREIVTKQFNESVEKLSKQFGGKQKTRRISKSSRRYRKKSSSK